MSKADSANLILKLYELRRDEKMREARNWIIPFFPESAQEIMMAMIKPETSAYFRMITTYWDMAASLVNHGAIDAEMFADANSEHLVVFSKIEPFIGELRELMDNPHYLLNLEKLIMQMPEAKNVLESRRKLMKRWMQARADLAKTAGSQ
jgi:hypothetical protein